MTDISKKQGWIAAALVVVAVGSVAAEAKRCENRLRQQAAAALQGDCLTARGYRSKVNAAYVAPAALKAANCQTDYACVMEDIKSGGGATDSEVDRVVECMGIDEGMTDAKVAQVSAQRIARAFAVSGYDIPRAN